MILQCLRCGKNDFKKTCDLTNHLNRKFKCKQTQSSVSNPPSPVIHVHENYLSIEDLADWLANPKIKNNPNIISKKIPKTDAEWFDLMEKSTSKPQKKTSTLLLKED